MNLTKENYRGIGMWVGIFFATLLVYFPAIHGGMIMDDPEHITRESLRSLDGLRQIWFQVGATAHYYPVLNTVFWLEYHLWGEAVTGYHLANILQHALAACLVMALVRKLALPGAWLAGLIFALHPVCVESVAWISEQKNTLSAVFFLSAALVYLGFDQDRRPSRYWLASALFTLALLTKTVTATLPPALLVIFWWQRGRLRWCRDILPLLPWFVIGATAGLFSAWFEQTHSNAQGAAFDLTLLERSLIAGRAICFYAGKLIWPVDLMYINPRWTIDATVLWQYLFPLGVSVVAAGLCIIANRHRGPLAAFLFFTGTLFPMLGFLNINWFTFSYVADHFQYLSSLGIIVPVVALFSTYVNRLPYPTRRLGPIVGGLLLLVLGAMTWRQSSTYRDAETLYRETLLRNPACWLAHNNLGTILEKQPDRLQLAITHYEAALRLKPDHARAYNNLGAALAKVPGKLPAAIAAYEASLLLQSSVPEVHNNLANALTRIPGRRSDAITEYKTALRLKPDYFEARNSLANLLAQNPDQLPEAITEYETLLRFKPDFAEGHNNLANALTNYPERESEAISQYETALRIKPDYPEAYNNLGSALAANLSRRAEAIAAFETALQIKPDYPEAHYNLGQLLLIDPARLPEAIAHFESALHSIPDDPEVHDALGIALARLPERLPDAIQHFETALRYAPNYAEAHFHLGQALLNLPGRRPDALVHFETVLQLRPESKAAREIVDQLKN